MSRYRSTRSTDFVASKWENIARPSILCTQNLRNQDIRHCCCHNQVQSHPYPTPYRATESTGDSLVLRMTSYCALLEAPVPAYIQLCDFPQCLAPGHHHNPPLPRRRSNVCFRKCLLIHIKLHDTLNDPKVEKVHPSLIASICDPQAQLTIFIGILVCDLVSDDGVFALYTANREAFVSCILGKCLDKIMMSLEGLLPHRPIPYKALNAGLYIEFFSDVPGTVLTATLTNNKRAALPVRHLLSQVLGSSRPRHEWPPSFEDQEAKLDRVS